jgi:3-oxoacyl-[acyl-carrier protein] reductase
MATEPSTRVALVPGGARGIGRGIALDLAARGWTVVVAYRTSADDANDLVAQVHDSSGSIQVVQADVSVSDQARRLVRDVESRLGRIDALILAAGPYHRVSLLEETDDGWHSMFANNLDPLFYLGQAVTPGMIARGWGRIISFSIARAEQVAGIPDLTAHSIAKTGVLILSKSLARVLAPHGITVNTISPGFIDSGNPLPEALQDVATRIPAGYMGEVGDAVNLARFLLSDEARYVNGANIQLGGAWGV